MEPLIIGGVIGLFIALFIILDHSSPDTDHSYRERKRTIEQNATFKNSFLENTGTLLYAYNFAEYKKVFYIREGCSVNDILYLRLLCSPEEKICVIQESGKYNFVKVETLITKTE